jgi:hypothetical protein
LTVHALVTVQFNIFQFSVVLLEPENSTSAVYSAYQTFRSATSTADFVSEQSVIALFAKVFDVSPEKAYLIAIPKLNENGKRMAELYNIRTIEAENPKEATKALKAILKK